MFIGACAFDQCIAWRTGNESLPEEWMNKTKELVKNKVAEKNDTEEYPGMFTESLTYLIALVIGL